VIHLSCAVKRITAQKSETSFGKKLAQTWDLKL